MRRIVFAAACCAALASGRNRSEAWCLMDANPPPWQAISGSNPQRDIPVYVNSRLQNICYPFGGSSNCVNLTDVTTTIRVAMDEYNDAAGSNVHFRYAGTTTAAPFTIIAGAVHIDLDTGLEALGLANPIDTDTDGDLDACRIWFRDDYAWDSMDTSAFNTHGLHGVAMHELNHCLGFGETNSSGSYGCEQNVQSIMNQGGFEKSHLSADDIVGLQTIYGLRSGSNLDTVKTKYSTGGSSWTTDTTAAPSQLKTARSRYSATGYRWEYSYLSWVTAAQTDRVGFAKYKTGLWDYVGLLPSSVTTNYHTGTAFDSIGASVAIHNRVIVAYGANYSNTTGRQDIMYTRSADGGVTWTSPADLSESQRTYNPGVAAAYDSDSDNFIVVWRRGDVTSDSHEEVRLAILKRGVWTSSYSSVEWPPGQDMRSADTPSIACGQVGLVGAENCLLAWTSPQWRHHLYYVRGHVVCGIECNFVFDPDDVLSHPTIIYGQPSLAYTGHTTYPWRLAFHQGGTSAYTMRKAISYGAAWEELTTHASSAWVVSPSAASRKLGPADKKGDLILHGAPSDPF